MRFVDKTVAGIDITQERISIVLLKNGKDGPKLIKSAVAPIPAGAIKDGNIADAALLSKAIRDLKVRNRIWTNRAAVSLFARPAVMQMIDMPKQMPPNMTQFVRGEMKHCAALPSGDIVLDYCALGSNRRSADKRILAVAAETKKVTVLVHVLGRAGFSAELVEPELLSYLRAVGSQKITGKSGCNVLIAILRETGSTLRQSSVQASSQQAVLTLCVLRNGVIDFIRTKEMTERSDSLNGWLADELTEIQKFYSVEVVDNPGKWEITVFADTGRLPQDAEERLKSKIQAGSLQVRTKNDAYLDTPVNVPAAGGNSEQPSPVAVGLAMNLLMAQRDDVRINLVPPQVVRVREVKRDALIAANAVAVMLLVMVLTIHAFGFMIGETNRSAVAKKQVITGQDTEAMVEQHQQLDARLNVLSSRLDRLSQISASHRDINWAEVFEDIRKATPASVRITGLSCGDGSRVQIEGLAMSNEAVSLFVNLLEKSHNIASVVLLEARRQDGQNGLIVYQLSCKLAIRSGKIDNVG
jgi:type IV pilus assembly protein PilM